MSFVGGGFGIGTSGGSGASRFSSTRGRINGSPVQGVNYPSPFFDVAHTYLPVTFKQMFRWCRYYFLTNPLINATVFKLSEYPITELVIDHERADVAARWTEYMQDHLRYRAFQVEVGLDYHCYGNAFVSIAFPFKKYLKCLSCGSSEEAQKTRARWTFTNNAFRYNCPKCGTTTEAEAKDEYFKNASGIRLLRWNAEYVEITYNEVSGEYIYFYTIPPTLRNDVVIGKKDVVESTPQVFLQAMREGKGVVFSKDNFFHLKRPTLAQQDRGWGIPLILPVLKDTFYLQLMKKAQEAILLEHIVPLRVLFPQAGSGSSDPYTTINLGEWRDQVASEIGRWRMDQNYIPIMPLPLGNQTIGGDGKALLLTQEIQQWSEQIMVGMGVPREFLIGGMSYAGTNVSMRMLENAFFGYILRHKQMAKWVMKMVSGYMEWPEANIRFKPFKMADDIQRKALMLQLNQAQKISDTTLLADSDLKQDEENGIMLRETDMRVAATKQQQLAMAQIQGEVQVIMAKAQVKAQQVAMEAQQGAIAPGEPGEGFGQQVQSPMNAGQNLQQGGQQQAGLDINQMAQSYSKQIQSMPPGDQEMAMQNITTQSPELGQLVRQLVAQDRKSGQQGTPPAPGVDMRPMPEQRAPRRAAGMV